MACKILNEKQNRMFFLDVQIIHENKKLTFLFMTTFTAHILTSLYHLPLGLALSTHSLIDAFSYAQVGLNCALN